MKPSPPQFVASRSPARKSHPPLDGIEKVLVGLEAALAAGAIGGAIGLITGAIDMGETTADLPFASPVLGGVALGLINGVLPAAVAVGALERRSWARTGHVVVGGALMGWIVVQVGFIGRVSNLQPTYFAYGAAVAGLGLWNVRRRSRRSPS